MMDACARLGLDTDRILDSAGVSRSTIEDPDSRIPIKQVAALWQKAYELSGDPNLALHAIEVLPFGAYRVIDYLFSSAPTIGAGLVKVSEYFPLINSVVRLRHTVTDSHVAFAVEAPTVPAVITRPYAEYTLAACFLHARVATDPPFRLMRVDFSHPAPPDTREHERVFGCPVRFGAEACQLMIARHVWDTPRTESDPTLFSLMGTHARMLLDQLPSTGDVAGRVCQAIAAQLHGGDPGLESIARELATSPRTLQRRLKERGVLFNDLLDETRCQAAKAYLTQRDIASSEVAFLLGFAEQSSFNHAFKRWSGLTPTDYRRRIVAKHQNPVASPQAPNTGLP
jgi:AraC-like DNA-binding protein